MQRYLLMTRVVLITLFKTYPVSTGPFTQYSKSKGGNCLDQAVTFRLTMPSLVSCAFKCKYWTECKNVNYNEETHFCIGCRDPCDTTSSSGGPSDGHCWKRKGDNYAIDCQDHAEKFNSTEEGVYWVKTKYGNLYDVFCLKTTSIEPPRWTVFLNRKNGSEEFNRSFPKYEAGFGDVRGNHWRGLKLLHEMTTNTSTLVLIKMARYHGNVKILGNQIFENFVVGAAPRYKLFIGKEVKATLGWEAITCLLESNNSDFSTKDRDFTYNNCSSKNGYGGWWWDIDCLSINPTGRYMDPHIEKQENCSGYSYVNELTMAFRRKN